MFDVRDSATSSELVVQRTSSIHVSSCCMWGDKEPWIVLGPISYVSTRALNLVHNLTSLLPSILFHVVFCIKWVAYCLCHASNVCYIM